LLFLHCKTCAIVIGLLKATYLLTYLLDYSYWAWDWQRADMRAGLPQTAVIQHRLRLQNRAHVFSVTRE